MQKASHFAIYVINIGECKMKLTETRIKEIILEEIQSIAEEKAEAEQQQQQPKMQADVEKVFKIMPAIDNTKEYQELVTNIMKFKPKSMSDSQKMLVLKNLRDLINDLLKGTQK
jgi:hypothetical protein